MVVASTIAALTQLVSAESYYENGLKSDQVKATMLWSSYYDYYNCYSSYDSYYGYYYDDCSNYDTIDWGWFFILLCCCPVCIWYYCVKKAQQQLAEGQDGSTTNIIYNDNNFQRAPDGTIQQ